MDKEGLKVSVIIPYNINRGYLEQAIASCYDQDGFVLDKDYEVIIQQGDCGLSENVNNAVEKAKGKYIKICAEDDRLTSNCLNDLYTCAESGNYDIVCANAMNVIADDLSTIYISRIPETVKDLAKNNTIHGGTTLYLKKSMPVWNEDMWTAEEYELHLVMASKLCRFGYIDELVYVCRLSRHSKSKSIREFNGQTRQEYIEDMCYNFMDSVYKIAR